MKVYFVGAGPGDPELLTLKADRLLRGCRICIYAGSLVSPDVLCAFPEEAERYDSAKMDLPEIMTIIEQARDRGIDVVRLHSGDPSIYGAIREQMNDLDPLEIPYEVVPGGQRLSGGGGGPLHGTDRSGDLPDHHPDPDLRPHAGSRRTGTRELARSNATLCIFLSVDS